MDTYGYSSINRVKDILESGEDLSKYPDIQTINKFVNTVYDISEDMGEESPDLNLVFTLGKMETDFGTNLNEGRPNNPLNILKSGLADVAKKYGIPDEYKSWSKREDGTKERTYLPEKLTYEDAVKYAMQYMNIAKGYAESYEPIANDGVTIQDIAAAYTEGAKGLSDGLTNGKPLENGMTAKGLIGRASYNFGLLTDQPIELTGDEITDTQMMLNAIGYTMPIDGRDGPKTQGALNEYAKSGPVTGDFGSIYDRLKADFNSVGSLNPVPEREQEFVSNTQDYTEFPELDLKAANLTNDANMTHVPDIKPDDTYLPPGFTIATPNEPAVTEEPVVTEEPQMELYVSPEVKPIQEALSSLGYNLQIDGKGGPETLRVSKEFLRDHDYGGVDNINTIQDLFSDQEALDIITAVANVNFSSNPKEGKKAEVYYDTKRLADDMRENPPEPLQNESNDTSSIINQDNNKDSTMGLSGTPRMKYNLGLEGVPISDEDDPESDELVIEKLNSLDDTGGDPMAALEFLALNETTKAAEDTTYSGFTPIEETYLGKSFIEAREKTSSFAMERLNQMPDWIKDTNLFTTELVEGALYGVDLIDTTEVDDDLSEGTKQVARAIGDFSRSLGLMFISGGISEAGVATAKALPWINRVSKAMNASKIGKVGAVAAKGALQGSVYTGLEYMLAPESRKPTPYISGLTTLEFSAGDVARFGANVFLNKFNINSFVRPLIASASDAVGGALATLAVHQDIDQTMQEIIAPQAVAMGAFELLMWGMSRGRLKRTPEITRMTEDLKDSLDAYLNNPTEANQDNFVRQLNNVTEASVPANINSNNANKFISDIVADYEQEQKVLIDLQLFSDQRKVNRTDQTKDLLEQLDDISKQDTGSKSLDDSIDQALRGDKSYKLYQDIKDNLEDIRGDNPEIDDKLKTLEEYEARRIEKPEKITSATPEITKVQDADGKLHTVEFTDRIDSNVFSFGEALENQRLDKQIEDSWAKKIQQDLFLDDSGRAKEIARDYYRYILDNSSRTDANQVFKPGSLKRADIEDWVYYKDATVKDIEDAKQYKNTIDSKAEASKNADQKYNNTFKTSDLGPSKVKTLEQIKKDVIDGFDLNSYQKLKLQFTTKPSNGDSVNTTRLLTSPETQELIKRISDKANQELPTKTLVDIDTKSQEFVNDIGYTEAEAKKLVSALGDAPEILTALKKRQVAVGETVIKMGNDLRQKLDAGGEPTSLEYAKFAQMVNLLDNLTGDVKTINRSVAQTLNSGNINVSGEFKSLQELLDTDLVNSIDGQNFLRGFDQGVDVNQLKKLISRLPEDVGEKLSDYLPQTRKAIKDSPVAKLMNAAIEWRTTNILSGIVTPLRNITSQFSNILMDTAVDYVSAFAGMFQRGSDVMTFSEATSRLTGNIVGFTNSIFNPVVTMSDAGGVLYGTKSLSKWKLAAMMFFQPKKFEQLLTNTTNNPRAGIEGMKKYFDSDYLTSGKVSKNPLATTMWKVLDYVGSEKRLISYGMLDITDRPFVEAAFQAELSGNITKMVGNGEISKARAKELSRKVQNYRKAILLDKSINQKLNQDGITGDLAKKRKIEIINEVIGENPFEYRDLDTVKDLAFKAQQYSNYMTWKDPMETSVFKAVEKFTNTHRSFKFILPFFHTGGRLLEKWMYSSGATSGFWRDVKGKNGIRAQNEAIGRFTVASLMYVFAGVLYATGKLTPVARDWQERQRMRDAGVLENAIKVGDKWYSLNNIDPAPGMFFSVAASVVRGFNESDGTFPDKLVDSLGGLLVGVQNNLVNRSWMKSVSDFIDFMSGEGAENYMESMLQSFDPMRPYYKNVEDMRYFGLNPAYEDKLMEFRTSFTEPQPRLDPFGKYITKYDQWMGSFVSEQTESPIRIELVRLNKTLQGFRDNLDGVELTPEQHQELQRSMDTKFHAEDRMNDLVTSSGYKNATDYEKEQMIDSLWRSIRDQARSLMYNNKEFRDAYKKNLKETLEQQDKELPNWLKNLRDDNNNKENRGTYQMGSWADKILEGE